jgi:hypothetical protein
MNGNEGYWGVGISIISQNFPKSPLILFHPLDSSISQTSPYQIIEIVIHFQAANGGIGYHHHISAFLTLGSFFFFLCFLPVHLCLGFFGLKNLKSISLTFTVEEFDNKSHGKDYRSGIMHSQFGNTQCRNLLA